MTAMPEICRRIHQIRVEVAGPRGKASFAKQLGLSASTYDYYESTRVPPAEVLVRMAEVAQVDLCWLMTGESAAQVDGVEMGGHPVLGRAAKLLSSRPEAAVAVSAFLDLLGKSLAMPKGAASDEAGDPPADWIPVLGRSAAGVAQFWSDDDDSAALTTLGQLVERHCRTRDRRTRQATVEADTPGDQRSVQIIVLPGSGEQEVVEFVSAPAIKARHPDAFAVRIDGESMTPQILHGDLVILSRGVAAENGRPAVVQLARQIGVTCKLYRLEERTVHLIPINERFGPQTFPADQVVWALRVLARVRE
jgi:SOS-response transcriptional repressor LexA/transcriptional regulator with XRE-family HTH domain